MPSTALQGSIVHKMWPMVLVLNQSKAHGILPDVIGLLLKILAGAQPVVEKVPLPFDTTMPGAEAFPVTHNLRHGLVRWECGNEVQVIGHQQKEMQYPVPMLVVEDSVFNQP